MDTQDTYESSDKTRVILDATEQIETLMEFDPSFQSYPQQISKAEAPPSSMGLMVLWFLVLLVQVMMFWQQKKKDS